MWWWTADLLGGEWVLIASGGAALGIILGLAAGASDFCIRSAALGLKNLGRSTQTIAWVAAVGFSITLTQILVCFSPFDVSNARQLSSPGSIAGALVGGAVLGIGIGFAKGCPSRQLILAARGNLRSVFTLFAIAIAVNSSGRGALAPLVDRLTNLWVLDAGSRTLGTGIGALAPTNVVVGITAIAFAIALAFRTRCHSGSVAVGALIGGVVTAAWLFSAAGSHEGFTILYPAGVSFAGPLGRLALTREFGIDWNTLGLPILAGTLIGAFMDGLWRRRFHVVGFAGLGQLLTRTLGGGLIGFGATAAGGCSIGTLSGVAVLSLTSIIALGAIICGLGAHHYFESLYMRIAFAGRAHEYSS